MYCNLVARDKMEDQKKLASQERENFLKRRRRKRRNQILLFELFSLWNLLL
jgi:predicted nucleic acid-binding Zn ribbon protein